MQYPSRLSCAPYGTCHIQPIFRSQIQSLLAAATSRQIQRTGMSLTNLGVTGIKRISQSVCLAPCYALSTTALTYSSHSDDPSAAAAAVATLPAPPVTTSSEAHCQYRCHNIQPQASYAYAYRRVGASSPSAPHPRPPTSSNGKRQGLSMWGNARRPCFHV